MFKSLLLGAAAALLASGCAMTPATPTPPPAAAASTAPAGTVKVQWLGQAAFKITTVEGKVIVIDPWLKTNPKTPEAYRKLEALGKVDLILVTHGHFDHMADAPELARMNNAVVWANSGLSQSFAILGLIPQAQRMNMGGTVTPIGPKVKVSMVKAEHSSELVWKNPASGKDEVHVGGASAGFIIEFENGFKLWHMGDTGAFGDMKLIAEMFKPDLVLLPIGGGQFQMNPQQAAMVAKDLVKPKAVIPMHYGTNPTLPGTPAELIKALGETSLKVMVINPGDTAEF